MNKTFCNEKIAKQKATFLLKCFFGLLVIWQNISFAQPIKLVFKHELGDGKVFYHPDFFFGIDAVEQDFGEKFHKIKLNLCAGTGRVTLCDTQGNEIYIVKGKLFLQTNESTESWYYPDLFNGSNIFLNLTKIGANSDLNELFEFWFSDGKIRKKNQSQVIIVEDVIVSKINALKNWEDYKSNADDKIRRWYLKEAQNKIDEKELAEIANNPEGKNPYRDGHWRLFPQKKQDESATKIEKNPESERNAEKTRQEHTKQEQEQNKRSNQGSTEEQDKSTANQHSETNPKTSTRKESQIKTSSKNKIVIFGVFLCIVGLTLKNKKIRKKINEIFNKYKTEVQKKTKQAPSTNVIQTENNINTY